MNARLSSLLTVLLCTVLTMGLATLVDGGGARIGPWPALPALALIAFAVQWLAFVPAYAWQTEHYYDLTGSATYLSVVWIALALTDGGPRALLLVALISIWALRLGSFLFRRVRRDGKDGRFDEIKPDWAKFLVAWTLQGVWVFVTLVAALIAITDAGAQAVDAWAVVGAALWLAGFGCEAVADAQKSRFKADPANRGQFIRSGLWAWSRHPNYFGEILLWIGVCVIAVPAFNNWQWLALISPLFVCALITGVSGVPMLEQRADEKWGEDADYRRYRDNTPVLIPRPPRREPS